LQHGKILVAASTNSLVVVRYETSGRLDPTFGERGFAEIVGSTRGQSALAIQQDRKILVATADNSVVRLLPNGRLDTHFGSGGTVTLPFSNALPALGLQRDQKVLVGSGNGNAWTITRLIGGNNCIIPGLHGKTISKARTTLEKSYCRPGHIA